MMERAASFARMQHRWETAKPSRPFKLPACPALHHKAGANLDLVRLCSFPRRRTNRTLRCSWEVLRADVAESVEEHTTQRRCGPLNIPLLHRASFTTSSGNRRAFEKAVELNSSECAQSWLPISTDATRVDSKYRGWGIGMPGPCRVVDAPEVW